MFAFRFLVPLALTTLLSLGGCFPYQVGLGTPDPKCLDTTLLGSWSQVNMPSGAVPGRVCIWRFSDEEYRIDAAWNDADGKYGRLKARAYIINIGGAQFLTLRQLDKAGRKAGYSFLRMVRGDNDEITLSMVSDDWAEFDMHTTDELRAFLASNLDNPDLYDKGVVRIRRADEWKRPSTTY